MKILQIQNIDASDLNTSKVVLPSEDELKVAALLNTDGSPLVSLWFEPNPLFYSKDQKKTRDRSSLKVLDRINLAADSMPKHELGEGVVNTQGNYFLGQRKTEGDWTIACVLQVDPNLVSGTNTSAFGFDIAGGVNIPSLNITSEGRIRAFAGLGQTTSILYSAVDAAPTIKQKLNLIVISQSEKNGATLRVNGVEKTKNTSGTASNKSTGKAFRMFGSDVTSAAFRGTLGTLLLLDADISKNIEALQAVEGFLMRKYNI